MATQEAQATQDDVDQFLKDFKQKHKVWGVDILSREINDETLLELEIHSNEPIEKAILSLAVIDYSEGPLEEKRNNTSPMWVFGKKVRERDVYIKISLGSANRPAKCFSFHFPKHPMKYPFKT